MHGASLEVKTNLASQCVEYEWNTYNFYFSFLNFFQCDCHLAKVLTLRENLWEEPSFVCLWKCQKVAQHAGRTHGLLGTLHKLLKVQLSFFKHACPLTGAYLELWRRGSQLLFTNNKLGVMSFPYVGLMENITFAQVSAQETR